jgi:hypothetical protein
METYEEAEEDPVSVAEEVDDRPRHEKVQGDIYDYQLYHVNTTKNYKHGSQAERDLYDFHQRKSKEIRRLQYSAGLGRGKVYRYQVWVVHERVPYSARILVKGNPKKKPDSLQILEGDTLNIEVDPVEDKPAGTKRNCVVPGLPINIRGEAVAPVEDDGDCDVVALAGKKKRWPIMLTFREIPPYRDVEGTNCEVFGPDGESRGRARFNLTDGGNVVVYSKGYLSDATNTVRPVLVKKLGESEILLKVGAHSRTRESVLVEEVFFYKESGVTLTVLTLEENSPVIMPRQVYFIEGMECLENIELLDNQEGLAVCTDCKDYHGKISFDGGFGFALNLFPSEDWDDQFVRIVMDNNGKWDGYIDIQTVRSEIARMASLRIGGPWVHQPSHTQNIATLKQRMLDAQFGKSQSRSSRIVGKAAFTPKSKKSYSKKSATSSIKKSAAKSQRSVRSKNSKRSQKQRVLGVVAKSIAVSEFSAPSSASGNRGHMQFQIDLDSQKHVEFSGYGKVKMSGKKSKNATPRRSGKKVAQTKNQVRVGLTLRCLKISRCR